MEYLYVDRSEIAHSPLHTPAAILPVPEYEEIQELHEARRQDRRVRNSVGEGQETGESVSSAQAGEHNTKADYLLTKCPAYAISTTV